MIGKMWLLGGNWQVAGEKIGILQKARTLFYCLSIYIFEIYIISFNLQMVSSSVCCTFYNSSSFRFEEHFKNNFVPFLKVQHT